MSDNENMPLDGIAVVGLAGRFPGSRNSDEFWQNLRAGREGLTFFTDDELEDAGIDLGPNKGKRVRSRGVVDEADLFDAAFFGYTPREAEIMDPQQRVFLELAWAALENAGFDPDRVPGAVGVYAGAGINSYYPNNLVTRPDVLGPFGVFPAITLNEKDFLATRVAYKLNLRGPAISVQTACSTTLVAICNACQSLLSYDCDLAISGGIALNFPQCHSYIHEEGGMISADGHCRPFDKDASGTLFSDGAGAVVLRRLEDAVESGDTILAVIKGYALNNDGSDKAGFTAPSVDGQAEVIEMAQAFADFEPDTISYIEAHGTATPLGDPIEIAGLTQAFRARTDKTQFCAIGSVKSNLGHADVAAGIAGFIKTVLALHHKEIPPTLHFTEPNPKMGIESTPFYVADKLAEWLPPEGVPRRAGVSSFGIGGTNAHVVLEEAPALPASSESRPWQLLPVAARSKEAVDTATNNLAGYIAARPDVPLADIANTLQQGRFQFNQRRVIVCSDRDDALDKLQNQAADLPVLSPGRHNPPVVFMFPGQGAQRVNMGRELYDNEPLYRDIVDECAAVLEPELGLDLRDVLFPAPGKEDWAGQQIVQTRITQPALFVTEYALAQLWMSWGVQPDSMIGHSVGEYVAACLAEVFSLHDGLKLIAARGRLIQEQPEGTMLAVMAGEDDVRPLLVDGVSIATINAPTTCVVSGDDDSIAAMQEVLVGAGLEGRPLHTSHAFHSIMMEPVVAPFTKLLEGVELSPPAIPFVSNLTAEWIEDSEATDPSYWAQHLRQAVRFADGAVKLFAVADHQVLLEVGPGSTLTSLTRMNPAKLPSHVVVPSLASALPDQQSEFAVLLSSLGRAWQAGVEIDWAGFYANETRHRVPLPTYPFERKRYFVEPGVLAQPGAPVVEATASDAAGEPAGTGAAAAPEEPAGVVERVRDCIQAVSGLAAEELGENMSFLELGFDSLLLSRACAAIDEAFGIEISHRQVTEELPSIAKLAAYIEAASPDTATPGSTSAAETAGQSDHESPSDITLPVTDAQREVWFASLIDEDVSRTYNEPRLVRLQGSLDAAALRQALQWSVDRHDALRVTFAEDGKTQLVHAAVDVELPIEVVPASASEAELEQKLGEQVRSAIDAVFDLEQGPLFRFRLYDLGNAQWALLLVAHHAVTDGWSWAVILDELGATYAAFAAGRQPEAQPKLDYADYVAWLNGDKHAARAASDEAWWLDLLADKPEEIELPSERSRPPEKTYASGRVEHAFDPALVARLKPAAGELGCTVFHLLTASFYAWLHRVTGNDDLVVAVPTAGQMAAGVSELRHSHRLVGHCVNMLPVRLRCDGEASFGDFLQQAKTGLLDARDHQNVSFQNLVNKLKWPRDPSRIPLASISLNYANDHQVTVPGLETSTLLPEKAYNFFDLTADMIHGDGALTVDCKFNLDLFDAATIGRWLQQWERLLLSAVDASDTAVGELALLTPAENELLLETWNATRREYRDDACLHEIIAQQCRQTPGKPAVVCGDKSLSYCELDKRANQFAHWLRKQGIARGSRVGICVERSTEMLAAVLGIARAGAAYIPLDPAFPAERLGFMADDANLAMLVSTTALAASFDLPRERQLLLDADADSLGAQPETALRRDEELDARPGDPAYLIYTSGTTGKPKGVVVPHRAVVNFLNSMAREPGLNADDVLVAVTTLSFDIAVLELYLPLTLGARVVIASRDEATDGHALKSLIERHAATVMQATPVSWRLMLEAGWQGGNGFKALVGGEALPKDLADQLLALDVELWNMYGPTETTVWSSCARITDTSAGISIGKPIDNTTIYILDERKQLCPPGVPGELYIGGDGVTLGYWQRPDLTADRFIADPFGDRASGTLYGTGDKARWRSDGTLEHLGRLDFQVKVRGFRIELGDIEAHIAEHAAVQETAVAAHEVTPGDQRLVAYVVASGTDDIEADIRRHLGDTLPEYMVPAHFVFLPDLPRTANGKIDRKALPAFDFAGSRQKKPAVAPSTEVEKVVAGVWAEVLGLDSVGIDENFFELGGHSLLAMQVGSRVRQALGVTLPLREYLSTPTVFAQAAKLDELCGAERPSGEAQGLALWPSTARPDNLAGQREEIVL